MFEQLLICSLLHLSLIPKFLVKVSEKVIRFRKYWKVFWDTLSPSGVTLIKWITYVYFTYTKIRFILDRIYSALCSSLFVLLNEKFLSCCPFNQITCFVSRKCILQGKTKILYKHIKTVVFNLKMKVTEPTLLTTSFVFNFRFVFISIRFN